MKIYYKCACIGQETSVDVPDRRPDTDIIDWMQFVQQCLGFDHSQMSPHCRAGQVEYAKIPMEGAQIGTPPTKN